MGLSPLYWSAGKEFGPIASGVGELDLSQNKIAYINKRAFRDTSRLTSIKLGDNRVKLVPDELLRDAKGLKNAYVMDEQYRNIYSEGFLHM